MIENRTQDDEIGTELSDFLFDSINLARNYLGLEDYDSTVVVLRISAASGAEGGLTERQISDELQFSRSTVNRILQRLMDLGHIEAISNTSPRRYVYTNKRALQLYGETEGRRRRQAHVDVINRSIAALLTIFWQMQDAQFDQQDK
jgi:predicted transcriptional regulator